MFHINSPVIDSPHLSSFIGGVPVQLKLDALQPSGSFKIRGIGLTCYKAVKERGCTELITSSGGNAGRAVAYAGRMLGVKVTVVVPEATMPYMRGKIASEGAHVIVHGKVWNDADVMARKLLLEAPSAAYIHPFDDPTIWEGHATMITELKEQLAVKPGVIVTVCGGGGLLCGIAQGLHQVGWEDVPILCIETEGAASYALALKSGQPARLDKIQSIATTLGALQVCDESFSWSKKHNIVSATVSDQAAVSACIRFADEHRLLVEPACGAGLAAVYDNMPQLHQLNPDKRPVMVIVCGGSATSMELLAKWREATPQA
eukprot:TRINITY_DN5468_c0_g1_i1.p1 TRINITY_DN5468_c0_g1~~TRINITY_DN5468_c0_g1_i1.p1  ORF type:complete len:329 (+),score=65.69 TRINITY_DN5468_c0_g1_i1:37-987(+)